MARAGVPARAPTSRPAAAAPGCASCGPTSPGSSRTPRPASWTRWSAPGCAATPATGARRSGCRRWTRGRPRARWTRTSAASAPFVRGAARRAAAWSFALPHSGNWDVGRGLAGARRCAAMRPAEPAFTTVGAAAAPGVAVPPVRRPTASALGFEVRGRRGRRAAHRALTRRLRARRASSACSPTATSPAPASRSRSSASRPGCPPGPARLAALTGAAAASRPARFTPDGWAVAIGDAGPGAGRAAATSRRPPRRWPTRSPTLIADAPAGLARAAADLDRRPAATGAR